MEPEAGCIELRVVESPPPPPPAPPPAHRRAGELLTLAGQAGWALLQAGVERQANADLLLAARRLGAAELGWTIVERLGAGRLDPQLEALFGPDWDVLEEAAMCLGFVPVMSAIDLCADAVLLACGLKPDKAGRLHDLGQLKKQAAGLTAPPALRAWIDRLLAHPDLAPLKDCRDHLTHRTPRRDITYRVDSRGMPTVRELAQIITLHGSQPARRLGSIGELVPRLVGFAEAQLEGLCRAILAPGMPD